MDLFSHVFNHGSKIFAGCVIYLYMFSVLADYFVVMSSSLQNVFYSVSPEWCRYFFGLICIGILIPLTQFRTLNSARIIMYINVVTILLAVLISLGSLGSEYDSAEDSLKANNATTAIINHDMDFLTFFSAQGNFYLNLIIFFFINNK